MIDRLNGGKPTPERNSMELENENTIQQEEQSVETDLSAFDEGWKIGRASCRERV